MVLRYDFDPERFRGLLARTITALKREDPPRKPRTEARIPMALSVDARALARALSTTLQNFSRAGCRLELRAKRLPELAAGDRLEMTVSGSRAGSRRPMRAGLEVRWVGRVARSAGGRKVLVGARFVGLSAAARQRIGTILRLEDFRPTIRIRRLGPSRAPARRRAAPR